MARIVVTDAIAIGESELSESFIASSGPGGQNVNKLATAVQLRFDAAHSPALDEATRARLMRLAGSKLTKDGVIVIVAREHRTQGLNREAARARLIDLIARAATRPKPRKATRPPRASKEKRLDTKARQARLKRNRARIRGGDAH